MRTVNLDDKSVPDGTGPEPKKRTPTFRKLEDELVILYTQVGFGVSLIGGREGAFAGQLVAQQSGVLAASWIDLAERDARVKRAIESLLQGGAWSGVIIAHVGVGLPVAAYMGLLPKPVAEKVMMGFVLSNPEFASQFFEASPNGEPAAPTT